MLTLPPIRPDVAVLHVPWADPNGNAILRPGPAVDHGAACAAGVTILSAERVVEPAELLEHGEADRLSFQVDHVVKMPDGARPTSCLPHYEHDRGAVLDLAAAR
jgi:glutaconate CoA-transferase subunit A